MGRLSSPLFIGRGPEMAEFAAAYQHVAEGEPATLVLAGEAGVGKTRFLAEFAAAARTAGARVLRGGCVELGHGVLPYGPVIEALRPLGRELDAPRGAHIVGPGGDTLAGLLPELIRRSAVKPGSVDADPARLFEALIGVLDRLGKERPTVLILEDLHWADTSTRDLFAYLARNVARERLLLVGSYRSDELDRRHPLRPVLAELDRSGSIGTVELARFSRDELSEQLAAIRGGSPDQDLLDRVFARSEGNAFFSEELIAGDATGPNALSATLRDILDARIGKVGDDALTLLRVAAVASRRVDEHLLTVVSGLSDEAATDGLRDALAHQVLVKTGPADVESYDFRHALLREAVYTDLLASQRKRLHRAMAEALVSHPELAVADRPAALAELAHHWHEARQPRDALAASHAAAMAAEHAYAFPEALAHYERVLDLWDDVPDAAALVGEDRIAISRRAAAAAHQNQDDRRALALLRAALADLDEETDGAVAGQLHVDTVTHFAMLDDRVGRDRAIEDALRLVPAEPPTATRSVLLRGMAWRAWSAAKYAEARAHGAEALRIARLVGSTKEAGEALGPLVFASTFAGDVDAALAYATQRRDLGEADGDPVGIAAGWALVGFVLQADLRFSEAASVYLQGAAFAREHGLERSVGGELEGSAAEALRHLGRWSESEDLARAILARGGSNAARAHELLALILPALGRVEEAEAHARAVWQAHDGHVSFLQNQLYYPALADIAIWRGEFERARTAIERGLELFEGVEDVRWVGELAVRGLRAEAELADTARAERSTARLAVARECAERILDRVEGVARRVDEIGSVFARESAAPVLLARAEWSRVEASPDPGLWGAAARAWQAINQPYQAAYARYREAEAMLVVKAARHDVVPVLRDAREIASALGAVPLLAEIDALGRRARIVGDSPAVEPIEASRGGDDDPLATYRLTQREREVLRLLVDGRSDRQIGDALFISDKTASVHVSNIKGKLGVATRVEAATLANRLRAVEVR